jgi:pseudouridine synthase
MASPLRACICVKRRTLVCRAAQQQEVAYDHPRLRPFPRRLSRFLVHSGWSGRNAKKLCKQGRVLVNNQLAEAATIVSPVHDIVTVDSNTIAELCAPKVYSMLNKPFNVVSSLGGKDCSSVRAHLVAACPCYLTRERCVLSVVLQDALTLRDVTHVASLPAVGHVGRLDRDSIGALLLTDDGDFSRLVSKPGICTKTYDVSVIGTIHKECLDELRAGGIYIRSIESTLAPSEVENLGSTCPYYAADGKIYAGASTLRVRISEGKHRQVW